MLQFRALEKLLADAGDTLPRIAASGEREEGSPVDIVTIESDITVMTEISERTLPEPVEKFILHWGDMGNHWGVNRSIAQIHALLYLSEPAMTAEEISAQLGIARSNVSSSLRELVGWKLIRRVPVRGDRRDHFAAETDLWEIVKRIAEGRKAREIDPALLALKECVAAAEVDPNVSGTAMTRLADMMAFIETMNSWYEQMLTLPKTSLIALISMGSRVVRALRPGR